MGSGVFLLPSSLAKIGNRLDLGLADHHRRCAAAGLRVRQAGQARTQAGGPYAYARDWFGPYMGFQTNTIYWFANWIGNVAIPIAAVGYFSYFFPILSEPLVRCIAVLVLVWALSFANVIGPAFVSRVQTVTTSFALVPILGNRHFRLVLLRCRHLQGRLQRVWRVELRCDLERRGTDPVGFIGVESASVTAGVVENPEKNVARATLPACSWLPSPTSPVRR